jgi:phage repressor protein C with HTH and peptisase S24 domain
MMSDLAQRIIDRLKVVGLTANAASLQATGNISTIPNILNGRSKNPRLDTLEKIAKVLRCRVEWLATGDGSPELEAPPTTTPEVSLAPVPYPTRDNSLRDVPVLGTAAGSEIGKGAFQLSTDVVEYVMRPQGLLTVKDCYALYVEGESMSPKFEPGDLVFVNPNRKPRPGDYVIVQEPDSNRGEAQAFIKLLVTITGTTIKTRQLNPPAEISFVIRPGVIVHRVMLPNDLYGV